MTNRAGLEAALAIAVADWERAKASYDKARADFTKASTEWEYLLTERRKTSIDRRKPGAVWDQAFTDRRKGDADRRIPASDILALSKRVAFQHAVYTSRNKAEADWGLAQERLRVTAALRDRAQISLDAVKRS